MHKAVFLLTVAMALVPMSAASAQQPPAGTYVAPNACWCGTGGDTRYGLEVGYWNSNVNPLEVGLGIERDEVDLAMAMRFGLGYSEIGDRKVGSLHLDGGAGGQNLYFLLGPSFWFGEVSPRAGARASVGLHLGGRLSLAGVASWTHRLQSGVGAEVIITL
jgi:hypothetical protein